MDGSRAEIQRLSEMSTPSKSSNVFDNALSSPDFRVSLFAHFVFNRRLIFKMHIIALLPSRSCNRYYITRRALSNKKKKKFSHSAKVILAGFALRSSSGANTQMKRIPVSRFSGIRSGRLTMSRFVFVWEGEGGWGRGWPALPVVQRQYLS